jgi:HEPN domain-containing protein
MVSIVKKKHEIDVSEWVSRSFDHLKSAKVTYEEELYDDSVFHAHQSIEMILKASWLRLLRKTPPAGRRGHMLHVLYTKSLRKHVKLNEEQIEFLVNLTPHYLNSRYPELLWKATPTYAKKVLKKAEEIVQCFAQKLS